MNKYRRIRGVIGGGVLAYQLVALSTFFILTFRDGFRFNGWNWIVAVPVNLFFSEIWPLYWLVLRWIF